MAQVSIAKMTTSPSSISRTSSLRVKSSSASATVRPEKPSTSSKVLRTKARPARSVRAASSLSSLSTSVESACSNCSSGKVQLKYVTRSFGKGTDLLVIEGIPMWSCPACGEAYFTAQTMHELERIKTLRKSVAKSRSVAVALFEEAGV
jgi:YgiT-type zinc finger domain-containing protein